MLSNAETLLSEGFQARRESRPADAKGHFEEAAHISRKAGDKALLAQALKGLGQIERDLNNQTAALALYTEAAAIYRRLAEPLNLAHTIRHVADILRNQKKFKQAAPFYDEALLLYRAHPETPPGELANAIRGLALLKGDVGDTEEATLLWYEAKGLYEQAGVQADVAASESHIAFLMGR